LAYPVYAVGRPPDTKLFLTINGLSLLFPIPCCSFASPLPWDDTATGRFKVNRSIKMRLHLGVKRAAADSDSGRSPSDDEKAIGRDKISRVDELPPDPDEHLTPEEKAEVVS
jgi:hypothetical protein